MRTVGKEARARARQEVVLIKCNIIGTAMTLYFMDFQWRCHSKYYKQAFTSIHRARFIDKVL